MNRRNYTGKTIFVGIDVHKKTYSVAITCDKVLIKRGTLSASPERLAAYLDKYFPGARIKSAYEAGFSGFSLHRKLVKYGIQNIVVHAAAIEVGARDRVKTDKRDAIKIATQLEAGRLKGIYVPTTEEEAKRALTRFRDQQVKERSRVATRLKSQAYYHGLLEKIGVQKMSKDWVEQLKKQQTLPEIRYVVEELIVEWEWYGERIKKIDEQLKNQAIADKKLHTVYRSAPGIGSTAARVLANELGDMNRFASERHLSSYTGLTPSEYSSGEHIRKGHISRQGNSKIRAILVVCSWTAIRQDEKLRKVYERIAKRAGGKKAIIAVARRLICQIRACFQNGKLYELREVAA